MKKICLIHQGKSSFVEKDIQILKEHFNIKEFNNYSNSLNKIYHIAKEILSSDIILIWFLGKHSVLPLIFSKLIRKKIILIAGGWDVSNCPDINYGLMRKGLKKNFSKFLFKFPNKIISVSQSNYNELINNIGISSKKINLIYHGFNLTEESKLHKKEQVITIGKVNKSNLKRKGLQQFVELAKYFPKIPFILIGKGAKDDAINYLKKIAPSNVKFTGFISDEELKKFMEESKVYAQLSYHEAFGCSLAEAMSYECVPVVTNQFALPEVVGDTGFIVKYNNLVESKEAIKKALNFSGEKARKRILSKFPLSKREEELIKLIKGI